MAKYRNSLPQLGGQLFITDGGLETTLIFHDGFELPYFAAFDLLNNPQGYRVIRRYYQRYAEIARQRQQGFILESPTWRASPDWAEKLGYTASMLTEINRRSIDLLAQVRNDYETALTPMVISGCVGPRGDGYDPGRIMTADQAEQYHRAQIAAFGTTEVDLITAITMTNIPEAIGIVRAAQAEQMPVVISFTTETDGRLPTGQTLAEAIETVDRETGNAPVYYMINCAHPQHFDQALNEEADWLARIGGIRANASTKSHAELDEAEELDSGNPAELGQQYRTLRQMLPNLTVVGGCCGTDHRHIEAISAACCGDLSAAVAQ